MLDEIIRQSILFVVSFAANLMASVSGGGAGFTEQELEKPGAFISRLSPSFSGVSGFLTLGRAFLNPEIRKDLADTGRLTADIGPEGVMTQNMLSCLEKILNLQRDALLSGKYSAESEVFVPGVSIDKL